MAEEADVKESSSVEQTTTEAAPSPAETKGTADSEANRADQEIAKDLAKETEGDAETEAIAEDEAAAETAPTEPKGADERKEELSNQIRQLVAQRNDLRQEIAQVNAKAYQVQTPQELVDQGVDPALARVEALEQRTQMAEFNAHVSDLNANLNIEATQVMRDFPIFDPSSAQYDKALADRAGAVYQRVAAIQTDPNTGLAIQANVLPYEIYKAFAETSVAGTQKGSVTGVKATEKMLSSAETPTSAAPPEPKVDNFLKGLLGQA